jgi:mannose/fructose/N-acetylgalactosamine-specific phosphotransferase system component IIC
VSIEAQFFLLIWGTLVGLDLVSLPQVMIARPLVAGAVAGGILGDAATGLMIGMLFELFQFDILPVGAVRYPEYGPATVAAVSAAHAVSGLLGFGLGAVVGLVTGLVGGVSIHYVRRLTTRAVHLAAEPLDRGDLRVLTRLHAAAIGRDALRAALVTAFGLTLAYGARTVLAMSVSERRVGFLGVAAVAAALATGSSGIYQVVGRGAALKWFAIGLSAGAVVSWLR